MEAQPGAATARPKLSSGNNGRGRGLLRVLDSTKENGKFVQISDLLAKSTNIVTLTCDFFLKTPALPINQYQRYDKLSSTRQVFPVVAMWHS